MEERILQLRVGIVVILAAIITGTLIFLFSDGWSSQYTLTMHPPLAPGVTRNTPVRKNGILIGRVARVETTDEGVLVQLKINRGQKIYETDVAEIGTESFLGDAVIEFVPGDVAQRGRLLVGGDSVDNIRVKPNPIEVVDVVIDLKDRVGEAVDSVRRAADTVDAAGQGITRIADQVETALGNESSDFKVILENIRRMTENADQALGTFNSVMGRFDEFLDDPEFQGELKETIKGLPEFFDNAQQTLTEARGAIERFKAVGDRAEGNLQNIEEFTAALGQNGPEILETLKSSLGGVDRLVKNVDEFSVMLRNSEGTFARVFNDATLYNNLNETLENLKEITTRVKPIMADLRVFADSLARDPGQLGVRGALQKRPAGSGYKGTGATEASRSW